MNTITVDVVAVAVENVAEIINSNMNHEDQRKAVWQAILDGAMALLRQWADERRIHWDEENPQLIDLMDPAYDQVYSACSHLMPRYCYGCLNMD